MDYLDKIDFVIIWVDGSDTEWKKEKALYQQEKNSLVDDGEERYRDWDNLKYWFRGVEKFAPWVNKVYFVTCGQLPDWLNTDYEKLVFVKHDDYMKEDYLPTFSSHPIELNLHKIEGLSEKFVYFNDDMFLTNHVEPRDFFRNNLPIYTPLLHAVLPLAEANSEIMSHIYINMITAVNRNFNKAQSIRNNKEKWFNPFRIGLKNFIMNIFNSRYLEFVGFGNDHLPVPMLKSTMEEVWNKEYDILDATSKRKFRTAHDVSQYLFRYWNLAKGNFYPMNCSNFGHRFTASLDNSKIVEAIKGQSYKMICINDMSCTCTYEQFEQVKIDINDAFNLILPEKSRYEK